MKFLQSEVVAKDLQAYPFSDLEAVIKYLT
jgi:hypothetical protein